MYKYKKKEFKNAHELALYIYCDDHNLDYEVEKHKYERDGEIHPVLLFVPYTYVWNTYTKDFIELFNEDLPFPYPELVNSGDETLIRHFHKSIYDAYRPDSRKPIDAWNDFELRRKVALNRLKYLGKCDPNTVLKGYTIAKVAMKVSVFKASLATRLIKTYLSDVNEIFDPFSGFSGRLIGAMNNGKRYIGQDINPVHIKESTDIAKYKSYDNCSLAVKDIFESDGQYESLFTCSPYNFKEIWNDTDVNLSCDDWIDVCLSRFSCKKYLFVVDETTKYKDYVVETIENKSHFGTTYEYVILITVE